MKNIIRTNFKSWVLLFFFCLSLCVNQQIIAKNDERLESELERKARVRSLLVEGRQLYLEEKFDEAIEKFHQVTDIKPNHLGARIAIKTVLDAKDRLAVLERENVVAKRMLDVELMLHEKRDKLKKDRKKDRKLYKEEHLKSDSRLDLEERLQKRIPEIKFTNAHLRDVIQYLHTVGDVNIIMDEGIFESVTENFPEIPTSINVQDEEEAVRRANGDEGYSDFEDEEDTSTGAILPDESSIASDRVTISLQDIPLIEALKYILRTKKLRYRIDDYAVWISKDVIAPEMLTRSYKLLGGKGSINKLTFEKPTDEGPAPGAKVEEIMNIKDVIKEVVPFPSGSKIFLDGRVNVLVITNTKENHDLIAELIEKLSVPSIQVEIQARFVEIGQHDAEELGLEFFIDESTNSNGIQFGKNNPLDANYFQLENNASHGTYGQSTTVMKNGITAGLRFLSDITNSAEARGNIMAIGGILGVKNMSMILHALSQRQNVDVLHCPKVTTLNGHQAQIKVVTEFLYPQEFEVIPAVMDNAVPVPNILVPSAVEAGDFKTREIGTLLTVTPDVGADRKTINLSIVPEISRFVTWMDFSNFDTTTNNPPQLMPVFSSDNVATSVVLNDGETVVLGGTVSTRRVKQHDKIPFIGDIPYLGRLFRSETETDDKVSLLIFVTARIITPNGETLKDEQMEIVNKVD